MVLRREVRADRSERRFGPMVNVMRAMMMRGWRMKATKKLVDLLAGREGVWSVVL